jgi:S-adenosylmethionine hydrolase
MGRRYDTVSLLTDLGVADEHVGVVKAVLRDLALHATVVDLTHDIAPYDVRAGSLALARCAAYLPGGVVVAAVGASLADPRCRLVAVEVVDGAGVLLGPDNGLLAPAVSIAGGAGRAVVLDRDEHHLASPGAVLPVRDVLAPVAALLCNGTDLGELGTPVDPDELLPGVVPLPRAEGDSLVAEVLWIDRLGNCQLNVGPDDLDGWPPHVSVTTSTVQGGEKVRAATRVDHAGRLGLGSVGLAVDPYGLFALVLHQRSAADELGLAPGDAVALRSLSEGLPPTSSPVTLRPR